jgi:hypothetical protein
VFLFVGVEVVCGAPQAIKKHAETARNIAFIFIFIVIFLAAALSD